MKKIVALSILLAGLATAGSAEVERVITTTGQGTVEALPDMATINVGVTRDAATAGEALTATSDAMRDVIARLETAGIAARDMQTSGLSLQPLWQRENATPDTPPRITGFVARNGLVIRVRELAELGAVLDAVVSDGANEFNGLQFSLQEPQEALAAARADAVRDAIAKARQLADAAGVTLGPVQSISETGGKPRPMMMEMAAARMSADVPVATGEVSLDAQVTVVFSIAD